MKVLVVPGYHLQGNFSKSIAVAFFNGAPKAGVRITYIKLYELDFNVPVTTEHIREQFSEPVIL